MRDMFLVTPPSFESVIETITELEHQINRRSSSRRKYHASVIIRRSGTNTIRLLDSLGLVGVAPLMDRLNCALAVALPAMDH
jgi:hypothetical protein